eukprot:m.199124 g.199124  ORF g.199124 m.199124 type:complete len:229 (+) comp10656_c0_seq1:1953-2639(+)
MPEIELQRGPRGLGFSFATAPGGIVVRDLLPGGTADLDGRLARGDVITAVNGISLRDKQHEAAEELLRAAGAQVRLSVGGTMAPGAPPGFGRGSSSINIDGFSVKRRQPRPSIAFRARHSSTHHLCITAPKAIAALIATLVVFMAAIFEGIGRNLHRRFVLGSSAMPSGVNRCYEWIMWLWYEWVLEDSSRGIIDASQSPMMNTPHDNPGHAPIRGFRSHVLRETHLD